MPFLNVSGVPIATETQAGRAPFIVWLGGFRSDMRGTKAERLAAFAEKRGHGFIRLDYSGHGESGGSFEDGTISRWLNEAETVIAHAAAGQTVIVVGSSMGAWIALRIAQNALIRRNQIQLAGMVLLAPAPDFTTDLVLPKMSNAQRQALAEDGYFDVPSAYSAEPTRFTQALFDDGMQNRVMKGMIETQCPIAILQGLADPEVPHTHALQLLAHLPLENVTLTLIPGGDHRLSREQDLALLEHSVSLMLERFHEPDCGADTPAATAPTQT
jgi:pimeloyl-ACP methyl ester carboxylesterase